MYNRSPSRRKVMSSLENLLRSIMARSADDGVVRRVHRNVA